MFLTFRAITFESRKPSEYKSAGTKTEFVMK